MIARFGFAACSFFRWPHFLFSQKCALQLCDEAPAGTKHFVLVDGNFVPPGLSAAVDADCVIGGDSLEYCIAAASIIAKVTRDRIMVSDEERRLGVNAYVRSKIDEYRQAL